MNSNPSNVSISNDGCSTHLSNFQQVFGQMYPYAALVICLVSMASNFSNVIILGQRKMGSSTNTILLAIAISDILVCISQIPLIISQNNPNNIHYYFWSLTYLCTTSAALLAHTASLWLGVVLAMFRLLFIKLYPSRTAKQYFGMERAKISIVITYIVWILLLVPYLTTMRIVEKHSNNLTYFLPTRSISNSKLEMYNFWNIAIFGKILPCTLTIIFGCCLLSTLKFARDRHDKLLGVRESIEKEDDKSHINTNHRKSISAKLSRRSQDHRRTTRLLVSIILLVLPTELPIACLMLATRIKENIKCIYNHLGDLLDFLSLLKNFLTFVLYCSMSTEYRNEFKRLFLPFFIIRHSSENIRSLVPLKTNNINNNDPSKHVKPYINISNATDGSKYHLIVDKHCPSTSINKEFRNYQPLEPARKFLYIQDIERSVSTYCIDQ